MRKFLLLFLLFMSLGIAGFAQQAQPAPTTPPPSASNTSNPPAPTIPPLAVVVPAGDPPEQCLKRLFAGVDAYRTKQSDQELRKFLDFKSDQLCPLYLVLSSGQYLEASRTARKELLSINAQQEANLLKLVKKIKALSQQEGSSSGTGGSTNLTSKGIAAKFISLASEYGALTQSTSNMTTTVQGTLAGLPVVLLNKGLADECSIRLIALTPCFKEETLNWLNRVSYSVSFDSSQNGQSLTGTANGTAVGNAQPATFTANTHTINAITAKYIAIAGKTIDADAIDKAYQTFVKDPQSARIRELVNYFQGHQEDPAIKPAVVEWQDETLKRVKKLIDQNADRKMIIAQWIEGATSFVEKLGVSGDISPADAENNEFLRKAANFALEYRAYVAREEQTALSLAKTPILTFEYDENRPAGQPTNSVFRAIYQHKLSKPKLLKDTALTANGAFSIYDSDPSSSIPGASRLRDIQAAFEADHDIQINSAITGKIGMTASAAYYFQHQSSPAILNVDPTAPVPGVTFTGLPPNATQIFAQKGNISIGQLKLSVGSGSNIKVPISVTYSNRTELVTKPVWRGQIGISYDFDSLFSKPTK